MIYKVFRAAEWAALGQDGATAGAAVDLADGFIHFSTAAQLDETLARHFPGAQDLVLAAVDPAALGAALRWEPSRGGELFPHLYARLRRDAVIWQAALPLKGGVHVLPPLAGDS